MSQGEPVSEPFDFRQGWVPYAASAVAAWAAIAAAWPLLNDFLPWFGPAMLLGVAVGTPLSIFLRTRRFHQYRVNLVVFGIAGILGAVVATYLAEPLAAARGPSPAYYFTSARVPAALFLHLFVWVAMFHAFTLVTEAELLLTVLPGMSVLVIAAVIAGGPAAEAWTLVWAAAAVVLFANDAEHGLTARIARRHLPGEAARRGRAALRGAIAFGIALPVMFAAAWLSPRIDPVRRSYAQAEAWTDARLASQVIRLMQFLRPAGADVALSVDLGGQAAAGKVEVFRVKAPILALYRGAVYDRYERSSWTLYRRYHEEPVLSLEGYQLKTRDPGRAAGISSRPIEQTFRAGAPLSGILYAAYEPQTVFGSLRRLRVYPGASLAFAGVLRPGSTYSVISQRKEPVEQADRVNAHLPADERARYLQLPESIPQDGRVAALARKIVGGLRDPYQKARAISSYLESKYLYVARLTPPPPGADGVEYFLFSTKGAYCDYFASALAVMCRTVGVPARVVTGFRTDDVPERDGWYVARQENAHAWVDVFVDGYGWTELDPSPIQEEKPALQRAGEAVAGATQAVKRALTWPLRALARVRGLWWKLPLVLAALVGLIVAIRELVRERPLRPPANGEDLAAYLAAAYRQMRRWLAKWGYPKAPGDTANEYAAAVAARAGAGSEPVEAIVAAYTAARYAASAEPGQAQQAFGALAALLAAKGALRRAAKRTAEGSS